MIRHSLSPVRAELVEAPSFFSLPGKKEWASTGSARTGGEEKR